MPIVSLVKTDPVRNRVGPLVQERMEQRTGWVRSELGSLGIVPGSRIRFVFPGACSANVGMPGGCVAWIAQGMTTDGPAGWQFWHCCAVCGCQTVRTPEEKIANGNIPREFQKVSMPDYVLEPPDLVIVEVLEALPGRPISGERLVRPDGKISLGFYGDVYVAGLTMPEVKEKIVLHLRKYLI